MLDLRRSLPCRRSLIAPLLIALALVVVLSPVGFSATKPPPTTAKIDFVRYSTSTEFQSGTFDHTKVVAAGDGALVLDPTGGLPQGTDTSGLYNGGAYLYGVYVSPAYTATTTWNWAVPSWEADTPAGTWIQVEMRALQSGVWTKYYNMGVWAFDTGTVQRHSVTNQGDKNGSVSTDTLILKRVATAVQFRATLFTVSSTITPTVRQLAAVLVNTAVADATIAPNTGVWGTDLAVPERSQMDYLPDGAGWCSPTSTSMAMEYWANVTASPNLNQTVPTVAAGCYDYVYAGTGNWPFNTAYAAGFGLESFVSRFQSMSQIEQWVGVGVPIVIGIAFNSGELTGAPISSTSGHLILVRGFDASGNVICNDPAADRTQGEIVRIVYDRTELSHCWLTAAGVVYVIYPIGWAVPTGSNGSW